MKGSGCLCLGCGMPGAAAPGGHLGGRPEGGKRGEQGEGRSGWKLLSAVDPFQVPRSSCHLLVPCHRGVCQSGREKRKRQWWGSSTMCNWFKYTVAPRSPAPTETQGRPRAQSSRCPCTVQRHSDIPAPLPPARARPETTAPGRPRAGRAPPPRTPRPPPPPGLRTGRGGGREEGAPAAGGILRGAWSLAGASSGIQTLAAAEFLTTGGARLCK